MQILGIKTKLTNLLLYNFLRYFHFLSSVFHNARIFFYKVNIIPVYVTVELSPYSSCLFHLASIFKYSMYRK
jgi:hypothetical protein